MITYAQKSRVALLMQSIRRTTNTIRQQKLQCRAICNNYTAYGIRSGLACRHNSQYNVPFTSEMRPEIKRGHFRSISEADIEFFRVLCSGRVLTDIHDLDVYNIDWMRSCRGKSPVVLKPKTTDELSEIMKYCNDNRLAVVPQGGNTSLVGGSVPVFDEVVVSLELMNKILHVDPLMGSLVCEAGCILETLNQHLATYELMMPLDLGAKGSCHIGGNIATNAGGMRVLRYGSIHANLLGLEVVLANGDVMDFMSVLRKDNTGYDLKHLFVGSEGTLGIITKAAILCPVLPKSTQVAFLGVAEFEIVLQILRRAKTQLADILSAFEFLDMQALSLVQNQLNLRNPISRNRFYVLLEVSGSNANHNEEKLTAFLEELLSAEIVSDGTIAADESKMKNIWSVRERLAEAQRHAGYSYKYDVSLPLKHMYKPVEVMRAKLKDKVDVCVGYGHVGDGNLHLNLTTKEYDSSVVAEIEPFLFEVVSKYDGSISAEHGLGVKKNNYIRYSKSDSAVKLMKDMKKMLDPNGILNPYKTLPTYDL
ncbi:D-2-hydroxyglutarate dehydrogenase, mitochondrial-like [Tubulanus polymorphus]|uniref:D-2-hydroxyglutarate dehydrogenase, mitochondrial-like n=1 Tax=Tubulanus polymorphus TaxID=672921 RepID=UPI003DA37893